ncbi:MAG: hypothetical protein CSA76_00265 [Spirochaetales bacterium]|nr:MAG: hypothetical protein CSA76_00265 [Spirochaetales bacterium]
MTLLRMFPSINTANTYIISPHKGGDAILIDPGCFNIEMLQMIENSALNIAAVLITQNEYSHTRGLRTLMKIYSPQIFAGSSSVEGFTAQPAPAEGVLSIPFLPVETVPIEGVPGHIRVYKTESFIFTGSLLSADYTQHRSAEASVRERILTMNEDMLLLPSEGPPTSVRAEKKWNPQLRSAEESGIK